jgi:GTP-binding protein HflX
VSIKTPQPSRRSRDAAEERLLRARQRASAERAVLVAVEFTSDRFRPSSVAQQSRQAAAISERGPRGVEDGLEAVAAKAMEPPADLDFDASLAEFQELARSAGATIAAVLLQRRGRPWWVGASWMRLWRRSRPRARAWCCSIMI